MLKGFVRYKEPLKIKKFITKIGANNKVFTSLDLNRLMNYKQPRTGNKWLILFERDGLIQKVKESVYVKGKYRQPAFYKLIQGR